MRFHKDEKIDKGLKIGGGLLLLGGLAFGAKKFLKKAKTKKSINQFNKETYGTVNLNEVAQEIALAFGFAYPSYDPRRWTEDEAKAMSALKTVPKSLIKNLAQIYYKKYERNLQQDFQKYLSASEYASIRSLFI
jgi:hypothetical protein